jgi:AhpD family alkylhydroperoxidase
VPLIPYPPPSDTADRLAIEAKVRTARGGRFLNLYRMLLHSPPVADGWLALGTAARYRTQLTGRQRELTICLIALLNDCEYEWAEHAPEAIRAGVSPQELEQLATWRSSGLFARDDRAVLGYVASVALARAVDRELADELRLVLDDRQVLELTAVVGYYTGLARFLIALGIDASGEESSGGDN